MTFSEYTRENTPIDARSVAGSQTKIALGIIAQA
jgi:hypothetical protein